MALNTAENQLIQFQRRPTIGDLRDTLIPWPRENPFGHADFLQSRLLSELPRKIAAFERVFPGARWVVVGRDQVFLGDIFDGFFSAIGQPGRVVRLDVSGISFREDSRMAHDRMLARGYPFKNFKIPFTGADADAFEMMVASGLNFQEILKPATPPFIIVDITRWRESSQVRKLLRAGYRAWVAMGGNPQELFSKFNVVATGLRFPREFPGVDLEDLFARQRAYLSNTEGPQFDPVFISTRAYNYTLAWHDEFGLFQHAPNGDVFTHAGMLAPEETRRQILADLYEVSTITSDPKFLEAVKTAAINEFGYKFPMQQVFTLNSVKKDTKPLQSVNHSPLKHSYTEYYIGLFEERSGHNKKSQMQAAYLVLEDILGMLRTFHSEELVADLERVAQYILTNVTDKMQLAKTLEPLLEKNPTLKTHLASLFSTSRSTPRQEPIEAKPKPVVDVVEHSLTRSFLQEIMSLANSNETKAMTEIIGKNILARLKKKVQEGALSSRQYDDLLRSGYVLGSQHEHMYRIFGHVDAELASLPSLQQADYALMIEFERIAHSAQSGAQLSSILDRIFKYSDNTLQKTDLIRVIRSKRAYLVDLILSIERIHVHRPSYAEYFKRVLASSEREQAITYANVDLNYLELRNTVPQEEIAILRTLVSSPVGNEPVKCQGTFSP